MTLVAIANWDSIVKKHFLYSVFYLAGEFARHLQRQAQDDFPSERETLFTNGEVICAEIAGLCHDLGEFCKLKAM